MLPRNTTQSDAATVSSSSEAEIVFVTGRLRRQARADSQRPKTFPTQAPSKGPPSSVASAAPDQASEQHRRKRGPTSVDPTNPPQVTSRRKRKAQPAPWPSDDSDLDAAAVRIAECSKQVKSTQPKRRRNPKSQTKETTPSSSQLSPLPKRRRNVATRGETGVSPKRKKSEGRKKHGPRVFSGDEESDEGAANGQARPQAQSVNEEDDPFAKWDHEGESIMKMSEHESTPSSETEQDVAGDAWDALLHRRRGGGSRKNKRSLRPPSAEGSAGVGAPVTSVTQESRGEGGGLFDEEEDDKEYADGSSSNIDDEDFGTHGDFGTREGSGGYYDDFEDEEEVLEKARQYREELNKKIDLFHSQRQVFEERVRLTREAMEKSMLARMLFFVAGKLPLWTDVAERSKNAKQEVELFVELPLSLHHGMNLTVEDLTQRLWPLETSSKVWNEAPVSLQEAHNRAANVKAEISKRAEAARKWAISNALGHMASSSKKSFLLKTADVNERVASRFPQEYGELQRLVAITDSDVAEAQAVLKLMNQRGDPPESAHHAELQQEVPRDASSPGEEPINSESHQSGSEGVCETSEAYSGDAEDQDDESVSEADGSEAHGSDVIDGRDVQKARRRHIVESDLDQSLRSPVKLTSTDVDFEGSGNPPFNLVPRLNVPDLVAATLETAGHENDSRNDKDQASHDRPRSAPIKSLDDVENRPEENAKIVDPQTARETENKGHEREHLRASVGHEASSSAVQKKLRRRHRRTRASRNQFIDQYAELSGDEVGADEDEDEEDGDISDLIKEGFITMDDTEFDAEGMGRINLLRQAQVEDLEEKQYKALFTMEGVRARRRRGSDLDEALSENDEDDEDEREVARRRRRLGIADNSEREDTDDSLGSGDEADPTQKDGDSVGSDWRSISDDNEIMDENDFTRHAAINDNKLSRSHAKRASTSSRYKKLAGSSKASEKQKLFTAVIGGGERLGVREEEAANAMPGASLSELKVLFASKDDEG